MKFTFKLMLCCLLIAPMYAFKNIETSKKEIRATLQVVNPSVIEQFGKFCDQYNRLVTSFFDTNNWYSMAKHIEQMEKNIITLRQTADDPQFKTVRHLLLDLEQQLVNLISLLARHIGSKNSMSLAWKVRHFKNLLPTHVAQRGDFALWWSLNHRLRC